MNARQFVGRSFFHFREFFTAHYENRHFAKIAPRNSFAEKNFLHAPRKNFSFERR